MAGLTIDTHIFIKGALIFLRISALFFALPFFGDQVISPQLRILMGLALAVSLYSLVPHGWENATSLQAMDIAGMMLREVMLGLVLGYLGKLIFEGLLLAANIVGYQMGFGTASLMMPGTDTQLSAFTALHRIVVLLIFLSLSLHYIFIHALLESFQAIPAGGAILQPLLGVHLVELTGMIFTTGMQLAAPILVALLFTMAALGLVARTVPQINVFTLSFPLSFFIGLVMYLAMTPFLPSWLQDHYLQYAHNFLATIRGLTP